MFDETQQPTDDDAEMSVEEQEAFLERLKGVVGRLEAEADRRVGLKDPVERRWIEDLRQYHGKYDDDTLKRIRGRRGSEVFINLTRPKTNAMIARTWDLLFPTDDRNWQVGPTPVPQMDRDAEELALKVEEAAMAVEGAAQEVAAMQGMEAPPEADLMMAAEQQAEAEESLDALEQAKAEIEQLQAAAAQRAHLMQDEIDDQLKEARWPSEARTMIEDAYKLGIGVVKGPILGEMSKRFVEGPDGRLMLQDVASEVPAARRVDPWAFFPDPDSRNAAESEGFYERHLMSATDMRRLARRPDIDENAVRKLLDAGPNREAPQYVVNLHSLVGDSSASVSKRFVVWEYTGPLDSEAMALLAQATGDEDTMVEMAEADPLVEHQARVWFCQGEVLSFALHPLDSGEPIYSWHCPEPDEAGPWGFGIPYLMRDDQSVLNGAQRMMMDNAAISAGPQIVVDDGIEPEDRDWTLSAFKLWRRNKVKSQAPAFETYEFNMNQAELANIIAMARQNIDEVTAMPQIAQGEAGAQAQQTATGMTLLMNSANVIFRRAIKSFDDDILVPLIRRFYHWNMQFSEREEIKGDYQVDARGASVLLVREMQAQNLMAFAAAFVDHPRFGDRIKDRGLLEAICRAHMLPTAEIVMSETEYRAEAKRQAQAPQDPATQAAMAKVEIDREKIALERDKLAQDAELANLEWGARQKIAKMALDGQLARAEAELNQRAAEADDKVYTAGLSAEDKAEAAQVKAESDERKLAAEIAMRERTGVSSGGAV